ncbi:ribonuclease Z, mitochondrial isoform X2 [Bombyx mori]|uniref:Zinc phosphodiesterase ELAC protein 2 n=2 Tax=Bombyx mori TaxID=7091 RepID=A0A8R2R4S8_BOMMO|nr:ribonuclease Z, mitochondrial isoform X8 [Bombyx mori]
MYSISKLSSRGLVSLIRFHCYSTDSSTKKLLEFLATMPKAQTARIMEIQRGRQNFSKKSEKYSPSTVYLQVLGSGARGVPNTLYLFSDQKRYLFNCGESTQRLAHEHKVKLSRLEHIFITSKTWRNIGGLPGLSLTLQDVGVPNITLHGPEGLDELYNATKRFVIMKEMNVAMAKCSPSEDFEDSVMSVKYVLLGPHESLLAKDPKPTTKKPKLDTNTDKQFEEFIHDDTDYYRNEIRNAEAKNKVASKDKNKTRTSPEKDQIKKKTDKVLHDLQKQPHCSVAYICTLKRRLGTLDLAKCVERGVKPGPLLGQLKNGEDVVLPDGTLVLSKDVKTPDDPGPVFIVMEVPEISYLKESEFSAHFDDGKNPVENVPAIIVHYSPPNVFNHPTYRAFLSKFGPTTRHLILNTQNSCLGSEAVHRTQHKLHLLDPDIFPLLKDVSVPAVWNAQPPVPKTGSPVRLKELEELKNKIAFAQFQNIINMEGSCKGDGMLNIDDGSKLELVAGRTLTMHYLRPHKQVDRSAEPKLHIQDYIQETMDVDGFVSSLEQFRHVVEGIRYNNGAQKEYPKLVFLGTGSCIPSKTRNTSCFVLHVDEHSSIVLDCGEGSFGQMVRFYGPKKVNAFLRTVKAIYISHLHADHHIGLIGLLQARREAFEESSATPEAAYLLAPGQIVSWLSVYNQQFERIQNDYTLIPNQSLLYDSSTEEMTSAILARIGVQAIKTCLVSHCPNAFGVAIDLDGTHKITYSGDTLPCEELIKIGENSTLLIHEATMEDELALEARMKMHSTTSQAIAAGRQMRAAYTLLTHFSQRYARLPRLSARMLTDNRSVGVAFDNMQVTMSDLALLPHMYAPLQLMFAEHCVEMEMKAASRAKQKERRISTHSFQPEEKAESVQSDRGQHRKSPRSRAASSSPTARARYRESNASRLRQEIKGMTVSGVIGRVPRSKSSSPVKSCYRSQSKSSSQQNRKEIQEKLLTSIGTPRTVSNTSNSSAVPHERLNVRHNVSTGHIVDTRSKTLNSVTRMPSKEVVEVLLTNVNRKINSANVPTVPIPSNRSNTGYGKPLVTSLNTKLTIKRDPPQKDSAASILKRITPRSSPTMDRRKLSTAINKAEVCEHRSPLTVKKREAPKSTPAKETFGFAKPNSGTAVLSNSLSPCRNRLEKSPRSLCRAPSLSPRSNKLIKLSDTRPQDARSFPVYNKLRSTKQEYPNEMKSWMIPSTLETQDTPDNCDIRQTTGKRFPQSAPQSTKSFKPQLEDIKSSFLLLNNGKRDDDPKNITQNQNYKPFDEVKRRQQLVEVKKKFQSKQFKKDALYDKIEGLNWISWK